MMRENREKTAAGILVLIAVVVLAAGATVVLGQEDRPPPAPTPPWVKSDGTVDMEKLPNCFGVAGPDGEPVRHADGTKVCIDSREVFGPPTGGPGPHKDRNGPDGPGFGRRYDPVSGQWYKP